MDLKDGKLAMISKSIRQSKSEILQLPSVYGGYYRQKACNVFSNARE
jgi:hypothetical protein